ncbi:MAG TPA: FAD-binding oxidoreductase [Burkholderiaceae bacterium]|nr:FAD-binding oxidoreductase [Burkholderiaceae bacterium]
MSDLKLPAGVGRILTDAADTEPFLIDWRKRWHGRARAVVQPGSTQEVATLVRWCAAHRVPIVPQGGNTGMSGGSVPDESGSAVVLSLARMNRVRVLDPVNNTATVEAGLVLARLQQIARDAGRLFPLSLGAEGSCTIGGNLATNAGGTAVLRYGNARELCLGLEVVTPDGEVWDGLRGLRKDNTGYDLRDLFIGSEGTLGVITAATMKLFPLPAAQVTAMAAVESPAAAARLLELAQRMLGAALTGFELISQLCIELVLRHVPGTQRPFAQPHPYYVLIESSDSESEQHATERFGALMERALEDGLIQDAAIAQSIAQSRQFWQLRESISEAQAAEGKNIKHDIALPISAVADFVDSTAAAIAREFPGIRLVVFGHLGDGNLHYNISPPEHRSDDDFMSLQPAINRLVHDAVAAAGGSISAEHGLGVLRRDESARYKSPVELALMRRIKHTLDPLGLMNPGKVLPE